jgi:hypothetical protein
MGNMANNVKRSLIIANLGCALRTNNSKILLAEPKINSIQSPFDEFWSN